MTGSQMEFRQVLTLVAAQLGAHPDELIAYAEEDKIGGYHIDESQRYFPMGSLWGVEGQMLYALIRYTKPMKVVEIGGWAGGSSTHMASAVKANGNGGQVISVDIADIVAGSLQHGELIPADLRKDVQLVRADGRDWLAQQPDGSIDFIFEDADHSMQLVAQLSTLALRKLRLGGLLLNHDAGHDFAILGGGQIIGSDVGFKVREGLRAAGAQYIPYLAAPSDCGLALAIVPGAPVVAGIRPPEQKPLVLPLASDQTAEFQGIQGIVLGNAPQQQTGIAPIEGDYTTGFSPSLVEQIKAQASPPVEETEGIIAVGEGIEIHDDEEDTHDEPVTQPAKPPKAKASPKEKPAPKTKAKPKSQTV